MHALVSWATWRTLPGTIGKSYKSDSRPGVVELDMPGFHPGVAIMSVGIVTNSGVLAVMVRARRQFGSSVHTLITNQCVMDLYTCVFGTCTVTLTLTHGYHYNNNNNNLLLLPLLLPTTGLPIDKLLYAVSRHVSIMRICDCRVCRISLLPHFSHI